MATLHRPFPLSSKLTPLLTTLALVLFIFNTTTASPVLSNTPNSITQLAAIGPAACEDGGTRIGKLFPRPRPEDCSSLAGQLRYDPSASEKQLITGAEHFLRGSGTCQLYIYTTHDGADADDVSLNELADGVENIVSQCFANPTYTGGGFEAGDAGHLLVWVTGHWDPWPSGNQEGLLEEAAANLTTSGDQQGNSGGGAANSTAVSANIPQCEGTDSVVGKSYEKPLEEDCAALSQLLRSFPAASHEQLITRREQFLRRSGTCQLSITTHPMIRPSQDYASFNDLADGIDSIAKDCIDDPRYVGGYIPGGTAKLLTLHVSGIWNPFGPPGLLEGGTANGTVAPAGSVDTT